MPEEVQGWELYTMLTLRGEAEFRAKLADINRLVDDTQKKMGGLGGGAAGGAPGAAGLPGNFAPLGGGPRPGIPGNFAPPSLAPRDQVTFDALTGAGATPSEAFKAMGIRPPKAGGGAGGGGGNFTGGSAVDGGGWLGRAMGHGLVGKGAPDVIPGGVSGGVMGAGLVGKGASDGMKELAKAAKDAAGSTKQFGLHQAWVLRAATSGGIPGMAGGGLGALAGLIPGLGLGVTAGALLGNFAGQMAGGAYQRFAGKNAADVEMGSPGMAYLREIAERDRSAASGRNYRDTYSQGTRVERLWGDFHASGGQTVTGAISNVFDRVGNALSEALLKLEAKVQGVTVKEGAGKGLAPGPLGSRAFGSVGEFHTAAAVQAMMASVGSGGARPSALAAIQGTVGQVKTRDSRVPNPLMPFLAGGETAGELRTPTLMPSPEQRMMMGLPRRSVTPWATGRGGDGPGDSGPRGGAGPLDSGMKMGGPEQQARMMDMGAMSLLFSSVVT